MRSTKASVETAMPPYATMANHLNLVDILTQPSPHLSAITGTARQRPRLLRNVLEPNSPATRDGLTGVAHTAKELRIVLKSVFEPVVF